MPFVLFRKRVSNANPIDATLQITHRGGVSRIPGLLTVTHARHLARRQRQFRDPAALPRGPAHASAGRKAEGVKAGGINPCPRAALVG